MPYQPPIPFEVSCEPFVDLVLMQTDKAEAFCFSSVQIHPLSLVHRLQAKGCFAVSFLAIISSVVGFPVTARSMADLVAR